MKVLITSSKHFASFQLALLLKTDEVLFGDNFEDFPTVASNSIAHQILKFCLDHQITQVFPLAFAEVEELRKSIVLFDEFGIELMISAENPKDLIAPNKQGNSFAELSAGLISLGYPNKKIAIADAGGRGELILIDDAVEDNLQVWNSIKSMSFTQIGKWFNQSNFNVLSLYPINGELLQLYVLFKDQELLTPANLSGDVEASLKNIAHQHDLKGFYTVSFINESVLRIVNTTF